MYSNRVVHFFLIGWKSSKQRQYAKPAVTVVGRHSRTVSNCKQDQTRTNSDHKENRNYYTALMAGTTPFAVVVIITTTTIEHFNSCKINFKNLFDSEISVFETTSTKCLEVLNAVLFVKLIH